MQEESPCVDYGDNDYLPTGAEKDLDGNGRIEGNFVDLGAYEY